MNSTPDILNIANGLRPSLHFLSHMYKFSSSVVEFDSLQKQNANAYGAGSQGSVQGGLLLGIALA